ncbi:unnamed protein product, partial [Discosporangium mesarthrocarpum]
MSTSPTLSVTVGARKVLLEDVLQVAMWGAKVDLHPATLAKEGLARPTDDPVSETSASQSLEVANSLLDVYARAAIFGRIVSYMNKNSTVRSEVISYLADLLNAGVVPLLPKDGSEGRALAWALLGAGSCRSTGGEVRPLMDALTEASLSPLPNLYDSEWRTVSLGTFTDVGIAALAAAAAANAVEIADGVSCLTCEAVGAEAGPFDSQHFDACRPHRGQIISAENLRVLLEGSKLINTGNTKRMSGASLAQAVRTIPQYHGPARESIAAACRSLVTELNSGEAGPLGSGRGHVEPLDRQQVVSNVSSLAEAVSVLADGALRRSLALRQGQESTGEGGQTVGE